MEKNQTASPQTLLADKLLVKPGMRVRIWSKIKEGDKWRLTSFEGTALGRKHGKGVSATLTVRRIGANEIGIEWSCPLHSPLIEKIDILSESKVRRAKIYYLRERSRREARAKLRKSVSKRPLEGSAQPTTETTTVAENTENKESNS